jgi:penicillin-binding protein 1A
LTQIANGPPDPQVRPKLQRALDQFVPGSAKAAQANPVLRANVLIPDGRYGLREEMKNEYGYGWREYVRGVTVTLDITRNMFLRERIKTKLGELQAKFAKLIDGGFTLDPAALAQGSDLDMPNVIVAAANTKGELVRYFELKDIASYFGSPIARSSVNGRYDSTKEVRAIASIGKMIAATAIANQGEDTAETPYWDTAAPGPGLALSCIKGEASRHIPARYAFACSLNNPIERRMAVLGQDPTRKLIDGFGFNMPPHGADDATPPTTAAVRGLITGSPQKVHQMAGVVLAALTGHRNDRVRLPTLVKSYDKSLLAAETPPHEARASDIVPATLIRYDAVPLIKTLLSAPLCNTVGSTPVGTLSSLSAWCAGRKPNVTLHFGKTGTQVNMDPDATVDAWAAGGIQFANGEAYSYVVVVGTGDANKPFAHKLHAAQIAAPLLEVLLQDLSGEVKTPPQLAEITPAATKGKVALGTP